MESDLKPPLIRAAESNNESEVKRLLDDRVDVNAIDDQGKTALFYAAQNDNESIAVLLIEAGADVDAKDNQDKTALFYAAANTSIQDACNILYALVEKGKALINATDIYGRNPLFYAITNSIPIIRYLLDHEADLFAEDNCNVSILTCLLEHCLMKEEKPSNPTFLSDVLSLLLEKGLERQSIVESILNLVFCKAPLLLCSNEQETAIPGLLRVRTDDHLSALRVAVQYVDKSNSKKKELILEVGEKIKNGNIFEALDLLSIKLRAKPNSTDSAGNTALHYTTVLPLMGVPQLSIMKICEFLRTKGAHFRRPNHRSQTPLLFCLSANNWKLKGPSNQRSGFKTLVDVCTFLLKNGSKLSETLQNKENVFHLMMKLFQQVFSIYDKVVRENVFQELIKLLEVFGGKREKQGKIGNKHDDSGNSPLHLWATLILPSPQDYSSNICENYTFTKFMKLILESVLKYGANVNDRNNENETPLHLCKTWTAVKLLIGAEANPKDVDSSGRSPLLVAAKDGFYSDVAELKDPKLFWKNAVQVGLDPWTADNKGESVLNILLESEAFVLARALVDLTCENAVIQDDTTLITFLNAIRKVESSCAPLNLKSVLLEVILSSRHSKTTLEESYRLCLMNMIRITDQEFQGERKHGRRESIENASEKSVTEAENTNKTFKEMSTPFVSGSILSNSQNEVSELYGISDHSDLVDDENNPTVESQFSKRQNRSAKRSVWYPVSKEHREKLEKVSIQQDCEKIQTISFHNEHIAKGGFGAVFVGIDENDGREVAIKRIQNYKVNEQEMKNLTRLADCEQVVRYLYYIPGNNFSYMILELMEGTLEQYLEGNIDVSKSVLLCKDVVMGLRYLHDQPKSIIHRDLKPANILYKTHPNLCLKIADFGLSLLIDLSSSTKYNDHIAGTKCWRAPEVINASYSHSSLTSADIFSCGLILHYILSRKKHPFSPADHAFNWEHQVVFKTEENIKEDKQEGWDNSLSPEATHLIKNMLDGNANKRPSAGEALVHPLFWEKDKKIDLLVAVGNQPEFAGLCDAYSSTSKAFLKELEETKYAVVKHGSWNDPSYSHMHAIIDEMKEGDDSWDTGSVVELVRFIQYAYMHFPDKTRSESIKTWLLEDFVFLEYFPDLVMEVYKAVTTHKWNQEREAIMKLMLDNAHLFSQKVSLKSPNMSSEIPWSSFSKVHHNKLAKVARREDFVEVDQYLYHKDPIATGQFGEIFAAINKMDGREVAIKRIDKMRLQKPEDKREIRNLTLLADCGQVVFYLFFFETEKFSYVILELMEGNLDELLNGECDESKNILLCKDVVTGMKYLHNCDILHRNLNPSNVLYKVNPKLCLKIADFGLSRCIDSTSSISVFGSNVSTRCWVAPEVLKSSCNHSKSSDNFSCGLINFYILSKKRHPFSPVHCDNEMPLSHETEANIMEGEMKGMDDSLSPEAIHLVKKMLDGDVNKRPSAEESLEHPLFWEKDKKIDLLKYVGNQPEFECPRSMRTLPLTPLEKALEESFSTIVKYESWIDREYLHMPALYAEMEKKRSYDTTSIVELVRFIRNAHVNVSEEKRPIPIRKWLLEDFVFLEYFPNLVMEVYKGVTIHGEDQTKQKIPQITFEHGNLVLKEASNRNYFVLVKQHVSSVPSTKEIAFRSLENLPTKPIETLKPRIILSWISICMTYKDRLAKVARRQECERFYHIWYHTDPISSSSFRHIFAGINEKDGREVAIKRIEKLGMQRSQDKREVVNLTALADCQQVVRYLSFFEDEHFSYVVLELMEGNLEDYLSDTFDPKHSIQLCQDVVIGMKYLHEHGILHRDLKPSNILYKVHPKLCLKIADFGLSRRIDSSGSSTVYSINSGTRCWTAPEVLTFRSDYSKSSDMFSCGLLLHYILSGKRHPFCPTDRDEHVVWVMEIEANLMEDSMEGWDYSLSPEATHLLRKILEHDFHKRPTAGESLGHPLFWAKKKKIDLLVAVGNQPEFEIPRSRRMLPMTVFETDLEMSFSTIVRHVSWKDPMYSYMHLIYTEFQKRVRYDTHSIVSLVRFIRNTYVHISQSSRATNQLLLEDFVFLEYFPDLVMEVYKAVTTHGWDQTREEIKHFMMYT